MSAPFSPTDHLRGNPSRRTAPDQHSIAEAPAKARLPRPPAGLPAVAVAEWKRVVKELSAAGLLSTLDTATLLVYVSTYAEVAALLAQTTAPGWVPIVTAGNGTPMAHPVLSLLRAARTDLLSASTKLGLTPTSRERLRKTMADARRAKMKTDLDLESALGG